MTGDFHEGTGNVAWRSNRLSFGCFILAILAYPAGIRGLTLMGRGHSKPPSSPLQEAVRQLAATVATMPIVIAWASEWQVNSSDLPSVSL
jgi:hypothetical protein